MKKTHLLRIVLAGLVAGALPIRGEIDVLRATPAQIYKEGFSEFHQLNNPIKERLKGYALMVRAAVAGHEQAKMTVADYDAGFVTPSLRSGAEPLLEPNLTRALGFLRELADAGYASAQVNLALLYSSGVGEPRHGDEQPQALLLKAAARRNDDAMQHLSRRYLLGHGVPPDRLEAARWFYHAFKLTAHVTPAMIDESGNPLAQDSALAAECAATVSLFAKADRGDGAAAASLAALYEEAGRRAEAAALYKLAAGRGQSGAAEKLRALKDALEREEEGGSEPPLAYFFGERN